MIEMKEIKEKGRYHRLPYEEDENQEIILPQFEKVPLEKVFQFRQPQTPLTIHPQIKELSSDVKQPMKLYSSEAHLPLETSSTPDSSRFYSFSLSASIPDDFPSNLPCIDLIVHYDFQLYALTVNLLSARNLPINNLREGILHPYVTLFILPHREDIFRSKTGAGNINPVFNERFVFGSFSYEEVRKRTLVLRVLDESSSTDNTLIGNVILPLHKTELHGIRISAILNEDNDIDQVRSSVHFNH